MYLLDSVMSIGEALNVSITGIVVVFIVLVVLAVKEQRENCLYILYSDLELFLLQRLKAQWNIRTE